MFVVKPLADDAEPRAFLTPKAAQEWAETDAYRIYGAEKSEIHWVDDDDKLTAKEAAVQAVEALNAGRSVRRATVHRRMSAAEIEADDRREAEAFLREIRLL